MRERRRTDGMRAWAEIRAAWAIDTKALARIAQGDLCIGSPGETGSNASIAACHFREGDVGASPVMGAPAMASLVGGVGYQEKAALR